MNDTATPAPAPASRTLVVEAAQAGMRLDQFLTLTVPELSRARARTMMESRQVTVNGRTPKKGDPVSEGDTVELLAPPPPRDFTPKPDDALTLVMRHEEDAMVALDKPAGMASHPLRPDELGTVANYVMTRFPEAAGIGFAQREPGLLHRLDTDTSGLILLARTPAAFEALRLATKEGRITKRYLALVEGVVESEGRVDYPLVPHRKDPKRVEAVTPHVRLRAGTKTHEAHTWYRPARALTLDDKQYTLLEVELQSAFRHQVRVHLATVGFPLVGDALYRGPALPSPLVLTRHFLHASELIVPHPVSSAPVRITSPLPADLTAVLNAMKSS